MARLIVKPESVVLRRIHCSDANHVLNAINTLLLANARKIACQSRRTTLTIVYQTALQEIIDCVGRDKMQAMNVMDEQEFCTHFIEKNSSTPPFLSLRQSTLKRSLRSRRKSDQDQSPAVAVDESVDSNFINQSFDESGQSLSPSSSPRAISFSIESILVNANKSSDQEKSLSQEETTVFKQTNRSATDHSLPVPAQQPYADQSKTSSELVHSSSDSLPLVPTPFHSMALCKPANQTSFGNETYSMSAFHGITSNLIQSWPVYNQPFFSGRTSFRHFAAQSDSMCYCHMTTILPCGFCHIKMTFFGDNPMSRSTTATYDPTTFYPTSFSVPNLNRTYRPF